MISQYELWAGTEQSLEAYNAAVTRAELKADGMQWQQPDQEDTPRLLDIQGDVGIISIKGSLTNDDSFMSMLMGATSYNDIRHAVVAAATNPDVKAILLDIDSGGGAVNGVMDTSKLIRMVHDNLKPVTAYGSGSLYSGAYWLGMAAGSVYAGETTGVGSIGVIAAHMEKSKQLRDAGIGVTVLRAGKYKALAGPFEKLSDEAKAGLQKSLDAVYGVFVEQVSAMRGYSTEYVDKMMAQGREFIGEEAVGPGLVDGITSFDALLSKVQAQTVDKTQKLKQDSYHNQIKEANMKKRVLTESIITALAEGAVQVEEVQGQSNAGEVAAIVTAEVAEPEAITAEVPVASEVPAEEPKVEVVAEVKPDAGIVAYLQGQVAEKDKALLAANVELSNIRKDHADFTAVVGGLIEVVGNSMTNMSVALDGGKIDVTGMTPIAILAEHKRLSEQFKSKFKAGGVGAVDAADVSAEPVKVDPLYMQRLASVRSTVKAK